MPSAIESFPPNTEVLVSNSVTLSCSATGIPLPNFTWSKAGTGFLVNGSDYTIRRVIDSSTRVTSELTVVAAEQQDTGQYSCTADNGAGTDFATFYLQVLGMLYFSMQSVVYILEYP